MSECNPSVQEYNPLRYFWALKLKSGEEIWQFNPDTGKECILKDLFAERPDILSNTTAVLLLPFSVPLCDRIFEAVGIACMPDKQLPEVVVYLEDGWRPILFRTNSIRMGNPQLRETFYHIGYQYTINGKNFKSMFTATEQGVVYANHPYSRRDPPKIFEEVKTNADS